MKKSFSLFSNEWDSFVVQAPGDHSKVIAEHEGSGKRLVRVVQPDEFHTLPNDVLNGIPDGNCVLLFKSKTSIKLEHLDLTGIINNEGQPFAIIDVETTGLEHTGENNTKGKDRVIELTVIRYDDPANPDLHTWMFNPGIPVGDSVNIHGITDEMLAQCATFDQLASTIFPVLEGCDIIGHNVEFDAAFLIAEFQRAGMNVPFAGKARLDTLFIFRKQIPHTLSAAWFLYGCNKQANFDAHRTLDDTMATAMVLKNQLIQGNVGGDIKGLSEHFLHPYLDASKTLKLNDGGSIVVDFGKYKGELLFTVMQKDMDYVEWMIKNIDTAPAEIIAEKRKLYLDYVNNS